MVPGYDIGSGRPTACPHVFSGNAQRRFMVGNGLAAWYVPLPTEGAGGFRTILQNITALRRHGIESDLFFLPNYSMPLDESTIRSRLLTWFDFDARGVFPSAVDLKDSYDLVVATSWDTAVHVARQDCPHKLYFAQDYEPWFFPMGSARLRAKTSYRYGLTPITIGRWMAKVATEASGLDSYCTDFGADSSVYHPLGLARERAVCAIYQPEKPRRAGDTLLEALDLVAAQDPSLTLYLYGSDSDLPAYSHYTNLGILSVRECNELYNRCLCGISLSTSNPSRIPFEMMASGLPVIDLYCENNLYDFPDKSVLLADPDPSSLATAILKLISNEDELKRRREAGIAFMASRDLSLEGEQFSQACLSLLSGEPPRRSRPHKLYQAPSISSTKELRTLYLDAVRRGCAADSSATTPLACKSTALQLTLRLSPEMENRLAKVAIWSKPNQEDLQWVQLDPTNGARITAIDLTSLSEMPAVFHFHVFVEEHAGERDQFVGGIDKALILSSEAAVSPRTWSREIGGMMLSIMDDFEGSQPPQVIPSTRGDSPLRRLIGLFH